jgi:opacity protein-like surface antigen
VALSQKVDYFGTLRGRVGWDFNSVLLYATGGLAWGHVTTTFGTSGFATSFPFNFGPAQLAALTASHEATESGVRVGYAVGAGTEWMFARNWSLKGEYMFLGFANGDTLTIPGGSANTNLSVHTVRGGINYHFAP